MQTSFDVLFSQHKCQFKHPLPPTPRCLFWPCGALTAVLYNCGYAEQGTGMKANEGDHARGGRMISKATPLPKQIYINQVSRLVSKLSICVTPWVYEKFS